MAKTPLTWDKGLNTRGDETRLEPGYLRQAKHLIYRPDDPDQLHKFPGRQQAAALPAAGGFEPDDVEDLAVWFKSDVDVLNNDGTPVFPSSGDTLSSWTDQSSNGIVGTAAGRTTSDGTHAGRPKWWIAGTASSFTNLPAVKLEAAVDSDVTGFDFDTAVNIGTETGWTVFFLMKHHDTIPENEDQWPLGAYNVAAGSDNKGIKVPAPAGDGGSQNVLTRYDNAIQRTHIGTGVLSSYTKGNELILTVYKTSGASGLHKARADGVDYSNDDSGTDYTLIIDSIGFMRVDVSALLGSANISLAEVLVYTRELTINEIENIEAYLENRRDGVAQPPGPSISDTKGIAHLQFESGTDQLLLLGASQLYETDANITGITPGDWGSVNDLQSTPVAFPRAGDFLKTLPTTDNRWIVWTGADSERALLRDEDGNWRHLGLLAPEAPTVEEVTVVGTGNAFPDANSTTPATVTIDGDTKTVGYGIAAGEGKAVDGDLNTYAYMRRDSADWGAVEYAWSQGSDIGTNGKKINLILSCSASGSELESALPDYKKALFDNPHTEGHNTTWVTYVQFSEDAGTNYTTVAVFGGVITRQQIIVDLTDSTNYANLRMRVITNWVAGVDMVTTRIHEVFVDEGEDTGSDTLIGVGTFYYAQTEVYRVRLTNGRTFEVESGPSPIVNLTTSESATGIKLTLGPEANLGENGVDHDPEGRVHFRRIYRSTKSGAYPDLGMVTEVAIDATVWTDRFDAVAADQLGSPPLRVVYAGGLGAINAAQVPPALRDATLFRGAVVGIPEDNPFSIMWSIPGFADYWPLPAHQLRLMPSERNDECKGIAAISDVLLVFLRNRVVRIQELPVVDQPNFDLGRLEVEVLSPTEGLAGGPKGWCTFHSQKGHALVAWISDNGVWMSDGSFVSERGLGVRKLSINMDFEAEVDVASLSSARLFYDPIIQAIYFDYDDRDGNRSLVCLHTAPHHWMTTGEDQMVPKLTGNHEDFAEDDRASGEYSSEIRHWSLDVPNLLIYAEREAETNAGALFWSEAETGWQYPNTAHGEVLVYEAALYHSDWGREETCDLDLQARRDQKGITQTASKRGVELSGARVSHFWINRSGQSVKAYFKHHGRTEAYGSAKRRALGPLILDLESMGDIGKV